MCIERQDQNTCYLLVVDISIISCNSDHYAKILLKRTFFFFNSRLQLTFHLGNILSKGFQGDTPLFIKRGQIKCLNQKPEIKIFNSRVLKNKIPVILRKVWGLLAFYHLLLWGHS